MFTVFYSRDTSKHSGAEEIAAKTAQNASCKSIKLFDFATIIYDFAN